MTAGRPTATTPDPTARSTAALAPYPRLKRRLKQQWRQSRSFVIRRFFGFTVADLAAGLTRAGIGSGELVLVHSAWTEFDGFTGKPTDVINALRQAVGPSGTILMPTLPFTGTAVAYARTNPVFDVRRTPSRMGMISEIFRRLPDTHRSVHPTHAVAAQGPLAADVCAGHHLATTPCGQHSPFAALADRHGKILLMGTGIDVLTFYHYVEELIEKQLPRSPFTTESYSMKSRLPDGSIVETELRLFEPAVSRSRRLSKLVAPLKSRGAWCETRVGRLQLIVLRAQDVVATVRDLADQGVHCYE